MKRRTVVQAMAALVSVTAFPLAQARPSVEGDSVFVLPCKQIRFLQLYTSGEANEVLETRFVVLDAHAEQVVSRLIDRPTSKVELKNFGGRDEPIMSELLDCGIVNGHYLVREGRYCTVFKMKLGYIGEQHL